MHRPCQPDRTQNTPDRREHVGYNRFARLTWSARPCTKSAAERNRRRFTRPVITVLIAVMWPGQQSLRRQVKWREPLDLQFSHCVFLSLWYNGIWIAFIRQALLSTSRQTLYLGVDTAVANLTPPQEAAVTGRHEISISSRIPYDLDL